PVVRSVALDASTASLVVGQTKTLVATVTADSGFTGNRGVTWSTSNAQIANVNAGVVTAVAPGTATITATSVANTALAASAVFTVTPVPPVDPCAPIVLTLGSTVQGNFSPTCVMSAVSPNTARVYSYTPAKSVAVGVTLSPTQSLAVGLDFERAALAAPVAGGSTVTYAVLLPAGAQRLAVVGAGNFGVTIDTTQNALLGAQTCTALAMPGVSTEVTFARNCTTMDVTIASANGKLVTLVAKHASVTPAVTLVNLPQNAPVAFGTSDQATHTTTIQLLPNANQFVRVQLLNANAGVTNTITITVSQ
ncbi:MAG TPA: Ig-like domain-containing protein, partial [Gemmatimonadaceae bacterium]|nr:Ig-like domain-containing protein [Gemmatimonadaceae bacterium]